MKINLQEQFLEKKPQGRFLTPNDMRTDFLSFFLFPLPYIRTYNKEVGYDQRKAKASGFKYLTPLVKLRPELNDDIDEQCTKMENIWQSAIDRGETMSLFKLSYYTITKQVHTVFLSVLTNVFFKLLYSYLMGKTIRSLGDYFFLLKQGDEADILTYQQKKFDAQVYAIAMMIVTVFFIYGDRMSWSICVQGGQKLKLIYTTLLYRKLNKISLSALNEVSLGRFLNIITADLNILDIGMYHFCVAFISPIVLVLGFVILYMNIGMLTFVTIGIMFIYMPLSNYIARFTEEPKKIKNKCADQRIKVVNEIIESIRTLKQYAWEELFKIKAIQARENEIDAQAKIKKFQSINHSLSNTSIYVAIIITLLFDTLVLKNQVTADKVFSTLLVLQILKYQCVQRFSEGMIFVVNFNIASQRVIEILKIPEIVKLNYQGLDDNVEMIETINSQHFREEGEPSIVFHNYTAYWNNSNREQDKAALRKINLEFNKTTNLTALVGRIGSGKTTFLLSLLNEIRYNTGSLKVNGSMAYVEQEPYVFEGTIKDNILFGSYFDPSLYQKVIEASCLDRDLLLMPQGDLSKVGEKGLTLSGGQRARLSFARALYSQNDIYILDDPLSAVDSRVAKIMFNQGIKQLLANKIVILVTHHLHFAVECQNLLIIKEGQIQYSGDPREGLLKLGQEFAYNQNEYNKFVRYLENPKSVTDDLDDSDPEELDQVVIPKQVSRDLIVEVSMQTMKSFMKYGGGYLKCLKLYMFFLAEAFLMILINRLFGYWAVDSETQWSLGGKIDNSQYFIVIIILLSILIYISYTKYNKLQGRILYASTNVYNEMISQIVRAKVSFFDHNHSGGLVARFTTDLNTCDQQISHNLQALMDGLTQLGMVLITVCILNPLLIFPSIIFILLLTQIKAFFLPFIRYSRNTDAATRGPINQKISETLNGLIVIRAYKRGNMYLNQFSKIVYNNAQGLIGFGRATSMMSLFLDLALYFQTAANSTIVVFFMLSSSYGVRDPGEIGFTLYLMIQLSDTFTMIFRSVFLIEINLAAVERMLFLTKLDQEPPITNFNDSFASHEWPKKGQIQFDNVSLKYEREDKSEPNDVFALRNLTFTIEHGKRVGIVGRTGAGKTSMLQALFRMVEIQDGGSILIDGKNIKDVGLHLLRQKLSIIPQVPVVFSGTVRRNLDPLEKYTTDQILRVLSEVGLNEKIDSLENGIETDMTISSSVFSVGQKQLICLARVMLQDNKIVVFDEATSNVDLKTDQFIQAMIKKRFTDCTVITIAHRLDTIADYDIIIVMDQGKIAEMDHPFKLMVKSITDQKLTGQGLFAQMVSHTGDKSVQRIFNKAKTQFMNQQKNQ